MSLILNGVPSPYFVLRNNGSPVTSFTLTCFDVGENAPPYLTFEPLLITRKRRGGIRKQLTKGFRATLTLHWERVNAADLAIETLFDMAAYDECLVVPWQTDKPDYIERFVLSERMLELKYDNSLFMSDFTLELVSESRLDYVPLEDADFLTWGNITLQFDPDLTTLPFSSYP